MLTGAAMAAVPARAVAPSTTRDATGLGARSSGVGAGCAALARGFWDGHKAAVSEVRAAATEGDVRWEYARALLMRDDVVRTGGVS